MGAAATAAVWGGEVSAVFVVDRRLVMGAWSTLRRPPRRRPMSPALGSAPPHYSCFSSRDLIPLHAIHRGADLHTLRTLVEMEEVDYTVRWVIHCLHPPLLFLQRMETYQHHLFT